MHARLHNGVSPHALVRVLSFYVSITARHRVRCRVIAGAQSRLITARHGVRWQVGGAFLGGLASGVPCSIWELIMIQQQRFGGSLLGTPLRIASEYGAQGIFRGVTTTCGRESMFTMAMLGITPVIQHNLVTGPYQLEKNTALAAGALTGACFAATLTHPLDTIKTCMQAGRAPRGGGLHHDPSDA